MAVLAKCLVEIAGSSSPPEIAAGPIIQAELMDLECFKSESRILSKNILSPHTKIWGFEFHKSVPRGTLFRWKAD